MDFRPRLPHSLTTTLMAAFLCLVFGATAVLASTGAIDPVNHYAWNDNGGYVNWNATGGNVTVTDKLRSPVTSGRLVLVGSISLLR